LLRVDYPLLHADHALLRADCPLLHADHALLRADCLLLQACCLLLRLLLLFSAFRLLLPLFFLCSDRFPNLFFLSLFPLA
jgi:hypothetical protein